MLETSRLRRLRSAISVSPLGSMLIEANTYGYSDVRKDHLLHPGSDDLEHAYTDFLRHNPEFADEFGTEVQRAVDFRSELFEPALRDLVRIGYTGAKLHELYSRSYKAGGEGTGIHDDVETGADLIVVRTVTGQASFECFGINRPPLSIVTSEGDVVAFRADMQHAAGPPIDGPRTIEGWTIKLA